MSILTLKDQQTSRRDSANQISPAAAGLWQFLASALPGVMTFGCLLILWQLAVSVGGIKEYLLPSPVEVVRAMFAGDAPWVEHISITATEIFAAFAIATGSGILLGVAIAWSKVASRALMPLLVFINTLPKVAFAPLLLLWLGYGIAPNIVMGALIGFFPVVINTATGLRHIDDDLLDLGRIFNAPKWKIFVKIRIPNALPYILGALKVTATLVVVGVIVGEFVSSQRGLGYMIITTQSSLNTQVAFAAVVWISVVGLALFGLVSVLAQLLVPWAERN